MFLLRFFRVDVSHGFLVTVVGWRSVHRDFGGLGYDCASDFPPSQHGDTVSGMMEGGHPKTCFGDCRKFFESAGVGQLKEGCSEKGLSKVFLKWQDLVKQD